ncbi:dihydromonapterin reductase [Halotalea alkalilenta]|uniref:Dihydromonapterin reductase n=1 Tax=Halotalea alkalilenta TaxID=376489 RepID=A0A172YCH6_9GAMM|nr:dihydromonapterin reductase [Halotalea alkalilenta]ANF56951.1 dihydromonapterin reductase [Halotalea alkalilenta]
MPQSPILVTGGAQRLGRYCAERLLEDGHPVIITYRRPRAAVEALRARGVTAVQADFSSEAGILEFIETLHSLTPSLRAIVHNASRWQADHSDASMGEEFELMFRVHMLAPYLINLKARDLLDACTEPMRDIVHISDFSASKGSRHHSAYASTKAGMENLTRSFAARFAPSIKVNSIAPAAIMLNTDDDEAYAASLRDKSVLEAIPGPSVIWEGLRYLLDARFVTGSTLAIDGGRNVK